MDTLGRRKAHTSIYLHPHQAEALKERSERTGVPQARMVREAIDAYLAKKRVEDALKRAASKK
jgi:predicted DNA-binding protein